MNHYTIHRAGQPPRLDGDWDSPTWAAAPLLGIDHFHEKGSDHRPRTQARLLYDDDRVYGIFRVEDRYVRSVVTERNGSVCSDSCVEFFVEPVADRGYFNFEFNCGGVILLHYNSRSAAVKYDPVLVDDARLDRVKIHHSMPKTVDPEIADPVTWTLQFSVPYELFESYVGDVKHGSGAVWRANFYKCGDHTSHPHWAMWSEIPGPLGFHRPEHFAPVVFA